MTRRTLWTILIAGIVISALFWIDPLFIPLALLGPIVAGGVLGWRFAAWEFAVLPWTVAGIGAVVSDWVINQEDVTFHVVLTVLMSLLALGAWAGLRALRRARTTAPAA